jgi:hypothetical protein
MFRDFPIECCGGRLRHIFTTQTISGSSIWLWTQWSPRKSTICLTEHSHISGKFSYNISASANQIIRAIFRQIITNSEITRETDGEIQLINPTTSPQYTGFFCMCAKSTSVNRRPTRAKSRFGITNWMIRDLSG